MTNIRVLGLMALSMTAVAANAIVIDDFTTAGAASLNTVDTGVVTFAGAGILGGVVYWMIAGRNAGAWRIAPAAPQPR